MLQGGADLLSLQKMEVMPMKNHFDFMDLLTFGIFLLAVLCLHNTAYYSFSRFVSSYIEKPPLNFDQ